MKWYAVAIALLLAAAVSFYAGFVYCDRQHAKTDLADTRKVLAATQTNLSDYQKAVSTATAHFEQDRTQLRGIAQDYLDEHQRQRQFYGALSTRLDQFLASRPDLAACDIGPDGLRLWNDANRGSAVNGASGAGNAATDDRSDAATGLPATASSNGQPPAGADEEPRSDGAPIFGLSKPQEQARSGGEDARRAGSGAPAARARSSQQHAGGRALVADLEIAHGG